MTTQATKLAAVVKARKHKKPPPPQTGALRWKPIPTSRGLRLGQCANVHCSVVWYSALAPELMSEAA